jgi:hypothetical protein
VERDAALELARVVGEALQAMAERLPGSAGEETPMTPLFRREALEAHREQRWGELVRAAPRWVYGGYWAVMLSLLGAGSVLVRARVRTVARGPAIVEAAEVVALLPEGDRDRLRPGQRVRLTVGDRPCDLVVDRVEPASLSAEAARRYLRGAPPTGALAPGASPVVPVRARWAQSPCTGGRIGTAEVEIASERALSALLPRRGGR